MLPSKVKDPVCKMEVDPKKASRITYNDKDYYFCGTSCEWAFDNDPEQYLNK